MKYSINVLFWLFLLASTYAVAQPKIFDIDGLKVIYKHVPKQTVTATFIIKGGTANFQKSQEGIEALALHMATRAGTTNYPNELLTELLENNGSQIELETNYDYSAISISCLKNYWPESWKLFKDILLVPTFDKKQFKIIKNELIAEAKYAAQTPEKKLRYLAMANAFSELDYEKIPEGSPTALSKLTLPQTKAYYDSIISRKNGFLVIVGDFEEQELLDQLQSALKKLPPGVEPATLKTDTIVSGKHQIHDAKTETNYLRGMMNAPKLDTPEGIYMVLAMNIINERIFDIVRRKNGLAYNPSAYYASSIIVSPYSILFADTQQPKEVIDLFIQTIDEVRSQGVSEQELKSQKAIFVTDYYLGRQSTYDQCLELAASELRGNLQNSTQLLEIVVDVSLTDINETIAKYTDIVRWTYMGDTTKIDMADFLTPK